MWKDVCKRLSKTVLHVLGEGLGELGGSYSPFIMGLSGRTMAYLNIKLELRACFDPDSMTPRAENAA